MTDAEFESELRARLNGPHREPTLRKIAKLGGVKFTIPYLDSYAKARVVRLIMVEHRQATGRDKWSLKRVAQLIEERFSYAATTTAMKIADGSEKIAKDEGENLFAAMDFDAREAMHDDLIDNTHVEHG